MSKLRITDTVRPISMNFMGFLRDNTEFDAVYTDLTNPNRSVSDMITSVEFESFRRGILAYGKSDADCRDCARSALVCAEEIRGLFMCSEYMMELVDIYTSYAHRLGQGDSIGNRFMAARPVSHICSILHDDLGVLEVNPNDKVSLNRYLQANPWIWECRDQGYHLRFWPAIKARFAQIKGVLTWE